MTLFEIENTIRQQVADRLEQIRLEVPIGNSAVQISGRIEPGESILTLVADFRTLRPPQAADLSGFLGLEAYMQSFPEPLHALQDIELSELSFGFELETNALASISVLANLPDVEGIPPALRLTNGNMQTTVEHPLDQAARQVYSVVHGDLLAGEHTIETQIDLPQGRIRGALEEGEQVDVMTLIDPILGAIEMAHPQGFPSIHVQQVVIEGELETRSLSFSAVSQEIWKTSLDGKALDFGIEHVQFSYAAEEETEFRGNIRGRTTFAGMPVLASADLAEEAEIEVTIPSLNLTAILRELMPQSFRLPRELPDLAFSNIKLHLTPESGAFTLEGSSSDPWPIPIGLKGLNLHSIHLDLRRAGGQNSQVTGELEGTLRLGNSSFTATYTIPGEFALRGQIPSLKFSPLAQALCGALVVQGLPVPVGLLDVELRDLAFTIAPQAGTFTVFGSSAWGQSEVIVKRIQGNWGIAAGFLPPANWKLSNIARELNTLDGLTFSNTALVVSTARDSRFQLETIQLPRSDVQVVEGLTFLARLDTTGLGIDQLLGLRSLDVTTAIGRRPADITLEAAIAGDFRLERGVVFTGIQMRLQPSPTNFSLSLLGTMIATLNGSQLQFVGGMEIRPRSATFQTSALGAWKEPFGFKAVTIIDLALELGVSWPPLLPVVGFAGGLQVGSFKGALAVMFDSATPGRSMLAVAFNRLFMMDILQAFLSPQIVKAIPKLAQTTVLNIGMEDVNVYIVPQTTRIGARTFEQGFTIQAGKVVLWGLSGGIHISLDYAGGMAANGHIDPIKLAGGLFELKGATGQPKASFALEVKPGNVPVIDLSAGVVLLGISRDTTLKLSQDGFSFSTSGNLFNQFQGSLEAWGSDLNQAGSFRLRATLQNDLLDYLRQKATDAIKTGTSSAVSELTKTQKNIDDAQKEVTRLDGEITKMRGTVEAERKKTGDDLKKEQTNVSNAQKEVNRLNGLIDAANAEIESTQKEIDAKKRWYDNLPWYRQAVEWAWLGPYLGGLNAKIAGLYSEIGTLTGLRVTANGVLEGYKRTVRLLENKILNWLPVDSDPRVAGLIILRATAWGTLEGAKKALELLKTTLGSTGVVASYIIANGLGGILDVHSASFEGALSSVSGGKVTLAVSLTFMKRRRSMSFSFNFKSKLTSAQGLGNLLLEG